MTGRVDSLPDLLQYSQVNRPLMTFPTFPDLIAACTDDRGCIRWGTACQAAKDHSLWDDFRTDYGTTAKFGPVDAGEFLVWLGY